MIKSSTNLIVTYFSLFIENDCITCDYFKFYDFIYYYHTLSHTYTLLFSFNVIYVISLNNNNNMKTEHRVYINHFIIRETRNPLFCFFFKLNFKINNIILNYLIIIICFFFSSSEGCHKIIYFGECVNEK